MDDENVHSAYFDIFKIMIIFKILANLRIILRFLANFIQNLVLHLLALIVLKREIRYADSIGAEYR